MLDGLPVRGAAARSRPAEYLRVLRLGARVQRLRRTRRHNATVPTTPLVIPSEIPWPEMKGEALEELLYWLCDALGAQDLQWRAGSASGTSRDRGRDLEATFHVSEPGGGLRPERWWIQAKGRAGTVPADAVKNAVVDVQAHAAVDVLVIATNTRVSNDTRDWVTDFQHKTPRPAVRLWEHTDLERMLIDHPQVVARVAPEALSIVGQLAAATAAYWNRAQLPPHAQLDRFWENRDALEFDPSDLITIVVGEAARGGLAHHPWGAEVEAEALYAVLGVALANVIPLLSRTEGGGHPTEPLLTASAHLVACNVMRSPVSLVVELLEDPWRFVSDDPELDGDSKAKLRQFFIEPIVERLRTYLGSACMTDCERVFGELEPEPRISAEDRWFELLPAEVSRPAQRSDARTIVMEQQNASCRAGLPLDATRTCPFGASPSQSWTDLMTDVKAVMRTRLTGILGAAGGADTRPSSSPS